MADVPIRLDAYLPPPDKDNRSRRGRIALAMCEFQIADEEQASSNESGENSHERYKQRHVIDLKFEGAFGQAGEKRHGLER